MVCTVRVPCVWRSHRIWVRSNTAKSRFCYAALWIQEWALKLACLLAAHGGLVVTYHASHVSSFCAVSREGINISLYSNSCILVCAQILQLSPAVCLANICAWQDGGWENLYRKCGGDMPDMGEHKAVKGKDLLAFALHNTAFEKENWEGRVVVGGSG